MVTKYLNAKNGIEIWHDDGITQILAGASNPAAVGIDADVGSIYIHTIPAGTIYKKQGTGLTDWEDVLLTISGSSNTNYFLDLLDTPSSYGGSAGRYLRVNEEATAVEFDFVDIDYNDPEQPLIPETAISGTYFVNFEGGRLLIAATGAKPDLVYVGPIGGLAFGYKADESCYGSFKVPYSWNTDTDIKMRLNFMVDDTQVGTNTVSWRIDYQTYADGESFYDKISTTINLDTILANNTEAGTFYTKDMLMHPHDAFNPIQRGDMIPFRLYRSGTAPADTATGDAVLVALMIEMTTGQHNTTG